jgi:hypothetical protein
MKLPQDYLLVRRGTYVVRGHRWKVREFFGSLIVEGRRPKGGARVSFEAREGSGAGMMYEGKLELAWTNDSDSVQDPEVRALVEEAFEAITAAMEAERAAQAAKK